MVRKAQRCQHYEGGEEINRREAGFWKGDSESTTFTEFKDLNGTTLKLED